MNAERLLDLSRRLNALADNAYVDFITTNYPVALRELQRLREATQAIVAAVHQDGEYDMTRAGMSDILRLEAALRGETK